METKNVLFIMADSLQFNYLGCYGNDWIKTPNIDRLAKEATVFENAYAEGLPTIPCRRAMMTGRYTLPFKGWGPLDLEDTTVADILWGRGVQTALIYDSGPLHLPKYGYSRGFDKTIFLHGHGMDFQHYGHDPLIHLDPNDYIEDHVMLNEKGEIRDAFSSIIKHEIADVLKLRQHWRSEEDNYVALLGKEAVKYLESIDRQKPFMLWLDSFDPHEPWDPPSVWDPELKCPYDPDYKGKDMIIPVMGEVEGMYTDEELHHIRMLYAEKITLVDKWIGKVLDAIRELGLWEDTMIVFCSDHGEPMGKDEWGHGIMRKCRPWPYEELARIPFIVRVPGVGEGKRIKSFVQSCDVAPTIIEFLSDFVNREVTRGGFPIPVPGTEDIQGHSVLPLIRGEKEKVRDFAIAGFYGFSWGIIRDDYSYVHWLTESDDPIEAVMKMYDGGGTGQGQLSRNLQTEEMWTCTPGAEVQIPQRDELYERYTDPFQLNNIIDNEPEMAKELLQQLKNYMAELRTT